MRNYFWKTVDTNLMKTNKLFLSLLLVMVCLNLKGQTTIDRRNYFTLGQSYPYVFLDNMQNDTALIVGNNVVWDFSNAILNSQQDTLYGIDPATTIFYNDPNVNYNLSNLCLFEPLGTSMQVDDSMYNYYIIDSNSVHFIGNWAYNGIWEAWYFHLTDTEQVFSFPFSLNDSFQDNFYGTYFDMSVLANSTIQGTRQVQADGFGTLILPGKVYSNCLRVKTIRTVSEMGPFGNLNYTRIYYTWFQLNTNGIILESEATNSIILHTKYYYDNPLITGINEAGKDNDIVIAPNPFASSISITLKKQNMHHVRFILHDVWGHNLISEAEQNLTAEFTKTIHFGDMPGGIYFLEIIMDGERIVKRIVKK